MTPNPHEGRGAFAPPLPPWSAVARLKGRRNGQRCAALLKVMDESDSQQEAARSDTGFSWLRPLGPDPDLSDVSARAAVVGRMAGRVAALASDLQLLAMLLQEAAVPNHGLPDSKITSQRAVTTEAPPARERERGGADDPFARAEAAVGALRAALRPGGSGTAAGEEGA